MNLKKKLTIFYYIFLLKNMYSLRFDFILKLRKKMYKDNVHTHIACGGPQEPLKLLV